MKRTHRLVIALSLTIAIVTGQAQAGYNGNFPVVINDDATYKQAFGTLVGTRNTPDNDQYLGCTINGDSLTCYARNSAGLYRSCSSANPIHVANARSISSEGYLWFGWNSSGLCTFVTVSLGSQYRP
jgi:hypothetical protein